MKLKKYLFIITLSTLLSGCSFLKFENTETSYPNDACKMLKENSDWRKSLANAQVKWGIPISVQLAIIRQESSFKHNIRPVRENSWYEFGENYQSSAMGYSQALEGTWQEYKKERNEPMRDRQSFNDSVDFIGWYNNKSHKILGISKKDSYSLYIAYHEGWGGYKKKTFNKKPFLKKAANNVKQWTKTYSQQINSCNF